MRQHDKSLEGTGEQPATIRLADRLRRIVDFVGGWGAWLIVPVVAVTSLDVILRKASWVDDKGMIHSLQLYLRSHIGGVFDSTMLQELEWHFHAALFALVLGYGVIYNTHVRIDLVRENLHFRKKAWLEFLGLTLFMIPYCAITIWFALDYVYASYAVNEASVSTVGLSHRWLIKSTLVIGLVVAVLSGIAAWLQVVTVLWGPKDLRFPLLTLDWPETDAKIEGKERVKLEDEYGLRLTDDPIPTIARSADSEARRTANAAPEMPR